MSLFDLLFVVHMLASVAFWLVAAFSQPADVGSRPPTPPRLELLRGGITRDRCPYGTHPAAATTESWFFKKHPKIRLPPHFHAEPIFQPRRRNLWVTDGFVFRWKPITSYTSNMFRMTESKSLWSMFCRNIPVKVGSIFQ